MAHVDGINIHRADHAVARAHVSGETTWLTLTFDEGSGKSVTVSTFMDYGRAVRLAQAFNDAWPEPQAEADPVITWPRPSYHRPAVGMRAADVLPDDPLPAWGTRVREMNGDDGSEPDEDRLRSIHAMLRGDDPEAA